MPHKTIPETVITNALIPLDQLHAHSRNYNRHPPEQIHKIAQSLRDFGQPRSIVVKRSADGYTIIAGHGVTEAARSEEWEALRADILPADYSEEKSLAYLVADNELSNGSDPDMAALAQLLEESKNAGIALEAMGFSNVALDALLADLANDALAQGGRDVDDPDGGGDDFDATPDEAQTRVQRGDIWQLGRHKIGCIDATDIDAIARLLDDEKIQALITDPPYGMRLDADFSGMKNKLAFAQEKGVKSGRKYDNVTGDHADFDATPIAALVSDVQEQFWFGADYYATTLDDTMHTGAWLVWDKRLEESADRMFGSCFELIWSRQKHKRDIIRHKWAGIFGTEHEPQRGRQHPNQKPLVLIVDLIERYVPDDALVADFFLGSGTILIACERTGRRCVGSEIEPKYADVVLSRWEKETGQTATLLHRLTPNG